VIELVMQMMQSQLSVVEACCCLGDNVCVAALSCWLRLLLPLRFQRVQDQRE